MRPIAGPAVYPITRGWRLFLQLSALGGLALIVIPLLAWMKKSPDWPPGKIVALLAVLALSCLVGAWAARVRRYRIEIHTDRIRYGSAWGGRTLSLSEIAGYRIIPTQYVATLLIVPRDKRREKISTALCYERKDEMLAWFSAHVADLDQVEAVDELAMIAADESLGANETERMARLAVAKRYAFALNFVGGCAGIWAFIFPRPYDFALWSATIVPLLALAVAVKFRGLVRLDGKPKSAYPSVGTPLILPPIVLALRAFLDWHLLSWSGTWPTVATAWVVAMILLVLCVRDIRRKWMFVGALICTSLYGFGATVYINCRYDDTEPFVYESTVRDRHISRGKHTTYHVTLAPFIDDEPHREISVDRDTYEQLQEGRQVRIGVFEGALGIPWFLVR